jgi:hypothetical protein
MSSLIIEVCKVDKVEVHPNAERLRIATVKGWKTAIGYDPATGVAAFAEGDKCVYFPPDAVLPESLVDRLGIRNYLQQLPKDEDGNRPPGGRVVACRLRGEPSFGTIMALNPALGDLDWEIGTNVAEHFGVTKFEPPMPHGDGQAEVPCTNFFAYTEIENFANYVGAIPDGDEVVYTEKIHGKNCRVGLVLEDGEWKFMAGSHDVRRKEFFRIESSYRICDLIEAGVPANGKDRFGQPIVEVGDIFLYNGRKWQVEEIVEQSKNTRWDKETESLVRLEVPEITFKAKVFEVKVKILGFGEENPTPGAHSAIIEPVIVRSEFWEPLTDKVKALLQYIETWFSTTEQKYSIMLYGELYGCGVQDMQYGMTQRGFRAFDLSINNKYLDFDVKVGLFK